MEGKGILTNLLELTMTYLYKGQECVNRFNYVAQGTPIGTTMSAALLVSIGVIPVGGVYNTGTVCQAIRNIQNPGVDYQSAAARDLYSNVDFAEAPFTVAALGLRSGQGDDMVPFIAWGTRTNRVRSDIRRGTKRFAGVSENDVNT